MTKKYLAYLVVKEDPVNSPVKPMFYKKEEMVYPGYDKEDSRFSNISTVYREPEENEFVALAREKKMFNFIFYS